MKLLFALVVITIFFQQEELKTEPRFEAQVIDSSVQIGYGLALGDVDGDGKPDILLADKKQFSWYRNGDWKKFVMIDSLTESDNVCIAASDVDGDGKVEVAVGAQWNPSETSDSIRSGSVHFLVRPADPTQRWSSLRLPHQPTIHRMRWIKSSEGDPYLLVLPLHGKNNRNGEGEPVNLLFYKFPASESDKWKYSFISTSMHMTHNFDIMQLEDGNALIYVAGKEGIRTLDNRFQKLHQKTLDSIPELTKSAGEIRHGQLTSARPLIATVEPMHGNEIVVYIKNINYKRVTLDDNVKEGHALAVADFLGVGSDQVVAGWRNPNKDGKVGIRMYAPNDLSGSEWKSFWIDENTMACEDLQALDLNSDGKIDIVASGRATKNLKIYWNRR